MSARAAPEAETLGVRTQEGDERLGERGVGGLEGGEGAGGRGGEEEEGVVVAGLSRVERGLDSRSECAQRGGRQSCCGVAGGHERGTRDDVNRRRYGSRGAFTRWHLRRSWTGELVVQKTIRLCQTSSCHVLSRTRRCFGCLPCVHSNNNDVHSLPSTLATFPY